MTTHNPKANVKSMQGHFSIIKALNKACKDKMCNWPTLQPYALGSNCTTHCTIMRCTPPKLRFGQKPMMPLDKVILIWNILL